MTDNAFRAGIEKHAGEILDLTGVVANRPKDNDPSERAFEDRREEIGIVLRSAGSSADTDAAQMDGIVFPGHFTRLLSQNLAG